ncbi:RsmF rRNA methyltransferase first C-terminal domain-containing protein [Thermotalea metallivorans]|uniref:Ribosomal RNA small subunit methyltransferase F n=1 Tax=Thermotalea metallivorans TaxID=520762 RepID=A0A140L443_9FIRM|nr:RsmB/NOP family class I SAM-dependent RNA methyltransferase [Thermotalea metallivorans]KXG75318.1 Ribosomal RNA small subunit methyltransferase F [Thermotalea metallivorans]
MHLPKDFLKRMQGFMQEEYEAFVETYKENKVQGLRINTLKISVEDFLNFNPFHLKHIPWIEEGFYYGTEDKPGKHPYHEAGLYYIQEPSAMAVATILDPKPRERILDLCAAPGGKSTHIAARLKHEGFLLSNEIHPSRAKILSQNIERMGIKNCVVTNESPERLAQRFQNFFHRILVDAPCSGEGMFRKDVEACEQWSMEKVASCARRQLDILEQAVKMLMPEGRLVYSTCTFSPEENEGVIDQFLKKYHEFSIEAVEIYHGFGGGKPEWIKSENEGLRKTIRLWPHRIQGEGHYIAVLKKNDGDGEYKIKNSKKEIDRKAIKDYFCFAEEYLHKIPEGEYILFGEQLYIMPKEMISLEYLKILRPGWHLGTMKKNRFEPSHAFALALTEKEAKNNICFSAESKEILSYLKGDPLSVDGKKGWHLIHVDGYSLGWGKLANNVLKNHYPKGLRWTVDSV